MRVSRPQITGALGRWRKAAYRKPPRYRDYDPAAQSDTRSAPFE
jgi:hypothetical protein